MTEQSAQRRIRVLVVEDSLTVRRYIVDVLSSDPAFEVVGEAADGRAGFEACRALKPDVVTLDMAMPVADGIEATTLIMAACPTPILIVSAASNRTEALTTFAALEAGAIDVYDKPDDSGTAESWEDGLRRAVRVVSRIAVIARLRNGRARAAPLRMGGRLRGGGASRSLAVVGIGASTGGPGAIATVLRDLPADFPLPILVVLHIGASFALSFAEWLATQTPLRVTRAIDGVEAPRSGGVWVAPGDRHLLVERGVLRLSDGPERNYCRPSVDVLFESLAREHAAACCACLLTGMGSDGAAGLLAIRNAGGETLAQDQASSTVWGMPRAAVEIGAAMRVLPLDKIAGELGSLAGVES